MHGKLVLMLRGVYIRGETSCDGLLSEDDKTNKIVPVCLYIAVKIIVLCLLLEIERPFMGLICVS